jgi:hypothetical protein
VLEGLHWIRQPSDEIRQFVSWIAHSKLETTTVPVLEPAGSEQPPKAHTIFEDRPGFVWFFDGFSLFRCGDGLLDDLLVDLDVLIDVNPFAFRPDHVALFTGISLYPLQGTNNSVGVIEETIGRWLASSGK